MISNSGLRHTVQQQSAQLCVRSGAMMRSGRVGRSDSKALAIGLWDHHCLAPYIRRGSKAKSTQTSGALETLRKAQGRQRSDLTNLGGFHFQSTGRAALMS